MTMPILYVMTTDPYRTWLIADLTRKEMWVESLLPRDPLPTGPIRGLIIDLDYLRLDRFGRAKLFEQSKDWVFPVALVSSDLDEVEKIALRSNGLIISPNLDLMMIQQLLGLLRASAKAA